MEFTTWSPKRADPGGKAPRDELLVTFDQSRAVRVLILPALFDEANKLRRFTISVMRALDEAGIDSALPDWPGCHESLAPLPDQTLSGWQSCAAQVADHFGATHTLSIRAGALIAPSVLPGWRYDPLEGAKLLSAMLRAQTIAAREAGKNTTREDLLQIGREHGLTLGGWPLGPGLLRELESAVWASATNHITIKQTDIGGPGLWLRAEPDENPEQSAALAQIIIDAVSTCAEPSA